MTAGARGGVVSAAWGDAFDILDFAAAIGSFDALDLSALTEGLAWNVSDLLTSGELRVVHDVDLDNDGKVNGCDLMRIQRTDPSLIPAWQALLDSQLVTLPVPASTAVPEPGPCGLLVWGALFCAIRTTIASPAARPRR